MIDLLIEMFSTPGTPEGPYERMAAAAGHAFIGVVICAAVLGRRPGRPWHAATVATLIYAIWEVLQMVIFGADFFDSIVIDTGAAATGAIIAACLWSHRLPPVTAAFIALLLLGRAGKDRLPRD